MRENIIHVIHIHLLRNNINCQIAYRLKDPLSIFKKLLRKEGQIQKIYDVIAIRIIVDNIENCYKSLEVINSINKINDLQIAKDYINIPKNNGYQSIHTLVYEDFFKRNIEIQIRTHEMHHIAEFGTANHDEYKKEQEAQRLFETMVGQLPFDRAYNIFVGFNWTLSNLIDYEKEMINLFHIYFLKRTITTLNLLNLLIILILHCILLIITIF